MDTPDISYGRLLGFLDVSSYSAERAVQDFKKLIKDGDWKKVGPGFEDINVFLKSMSLANYKIGVENRQEIATMLSDIDASQRATAKALGVSDTTIIRDLNPPATYVAPQENSDNKSIHANELEQPKHDSATYVAPPTKTGADLVIEEGKEAEKVAKKDANLEIKKTRVIEETKEVLKTDPVILHAACMDIINTVEPIDLLIADPPYFTDGNFTEEISAYLSKVKPTGQAYIFAGADPVEVAEYIAMNSHHMELIQILVWNYNNTGQRQPNSRYNSNYQVCFYYRGVDANPINKPADGKEQYSCQTINAPDGRQGDRHHAWQKPIDLIERLIRNSSDENDFIFDPFAGTGTTLLAASKLGRRNSGCEKNIDMVNICTDRGCVRGN